MTFAAANPGLEEMQAMVRGVDDVRAKHPVPTGFNVLESGLPVLRVGIVRDLEKDQARLMPLAGVLYLITLAIAFRSLSGSLLPLFAVGQGLVWTFGFIAARGEALNIVSNILPCMLLINGVSNSIHVLTRYSEEAVHPGGQGRQPPHDPTNDRGLPRRLCDRGLRLLRPADRQLARAARVRNASGDGPLVLVHHGDFDTRLAASFFKPPAFQDPGRGNRSALADAAAMIVRWKWTTVAAFFAIAGLSIWRASGVEINSSTLETYDENHPTIQTLHTLEDRLSGLLPLEISLTVDNPDRFYQADIYRKVAELQQFAGQQKAVLFARSYIDYFNEINGNFVSAEQRAHYRRRAKKVSG